MSGSKEKNELQDLWKQSIKLIESYEGRKKTVDAHLDHFVEKQECKKEETIDFLREVIVGIDQQRALVEQVVKQYYEKNKEASIKDIKKYEFLTFLIYCKLEVAINMAQLKAIVKKGLSPPKLYPFLSFLVDEEAIYMYIIPGLLLHYDHKWIKETFMVHIEQIRDEINEWSQKVRIVATGEKQITEDALPKITKPEPFNLTKGKMKLIPQPTLIETTFKAAPVPESTYECEPQVRKALDDYKKGVNSAMVSDDVKELHRTKQDRMNKGPLFTALNERKDKASEFKKTKIAATSKVEASKEAALATSLKPKSLDEVRRMLNKPAPVKYNATAILREDAILKAKQKREEQILRKFESELRDASEFYEWQEEMRARDELEKELKVKQRKLEMELSDARARQARIDQETRNAEHAKEMKEELEIKLEKVKKERIAVKQAKKEAAEAQAAAIKQAVDEAKRKAKEERTEAAEAVRIEKKKNELRVARELELERQRREEQILQIRAKESVSDASIPKFDGTTTAGNGLLGEMSYVELQERLELKEKEDALVLEQKKESIQEKRNRKRQNLQQRAKSIAENREQVRLAARKKHMSKLRTQRLKRAMAQEARDAKILSLQSQIDSLKAEKQKVATARAKREKERQMKANFLGASKSAVEKKHWGQQEKGREREAKIASAAPPNVEKVFRAKQNRMDANRKRREDKARSKKVSAIDASIRAQLDINRTTNENEFAAKRFNAARQHDHEVRQRKTLRAQKEMSRPLPV